MMTQLFPSDTWQNGGIPASKYKSDLFPLKETPTSFSNNVSTTFALSNLQKQFNISMWREKKDRVFGITITIQMNSIIEQILVT